MPAPANATTVVTLTFPLHDRTFLITFKPELPAARRWVVTVIRGKEVWATAVSAHASLWTALISVERSMALFNDGTNLL